MDLGIAGRTAIVTGASKGIGRAVAERLAGEGAKLSLVGRTPETLEEAAATLAAGGTDVATFAADVGDPTAAQLVVDATVERFGALHILINNSGGPPPGTYEEHDDEAWDRALATLLRGAMRFTEAAAPYMMRERWGRIVNVSSTIAREPSPSMVLSATPRAALVAYAKALATQLAPHGVTVNTVLPANVLTGRAETLIRTAAEREGVSYAEALARAQQALPVGRLAAPDEVAALIAFLASAPASYVSGTAIAADAGLVKSIF